MNKPHQRLFFALWPDDAVRKQLHQRYLTMQGLQGQGRPLQNANLHITLHFLGNVALDEIDCFIDRARRVITHAFSLKLTHTGYFKKPKIVWIGMDDVPQELSRLHASLAKQIRHCGFKPEQRPYCPHVTMARKVTRDPGDSEIQPITWQVDRFVLIRSESVAEGVRYRVKHSFPLLKRSGFRGD